MRDRELSPLSPRGRSLPSSLSSSPERGTSQHKAKTTVSSLEVKALPDPPQTFRGRWRRFWERPLLNTWLAEILALTFSASCLVAIIIVLKIYDSKSIPQIPFGLTLNAIISILATGSKSSLLLAVAGAISQLKWCWFTGKRRTLENIQDFDDASRGPWGSLSLLFTINIRSLASLGALITLLTLAYDPFVQQVLIYPVREIQSSSNETSTTQAIVFTPDVSTPEFGDALNAGIWGDEAAFVRKPSCPSGNCNWPMFRSVGWCSKCENVTTRVVLDDCPFERLFDTRITNLTCNLTLDGGAGVSYAWGNSSRALNKDDDHPKWINYTDMDLLSQVLWPVHQSVEDTGPTILGVENPALAYGYASLWYLGDGQPWPDTIIRARVHHAEQCILTPCARTYNISTRHGETHAEILEENYGLSLNYRVPSHRNVYSPFQTDGIFCWQADPGNLTWHYIDDMKLHGARFGYENPWIPFVAERYDNVSHWGFCTLRPYQDAITGVLAGTASLHSYGEIPGSGLPEVWEFLEAYPYAESGQAPEFSNKALQKIMSTNLTSVTTGLAASLTKLGLDLSNLTVSGNVSVSEVYVHAEWKWMVFPIALEALGILLVLSTIVASHSQKARLWKSSVLPLLYHGLDESVHKDQSIPQDVFAMEELARKTKVRLQGPLLDDRVMFAA